MILRVVLILCSLYPLLSIGQAVVIDVEYQSNTTYKWTRAIGYDSTVEFIGAEDMADFLMGVGMEPYSESQWSRYLEVTMNTADWDSQKLYFNSSIDSLEKELVLSTSRPSYLEEEVPLEIDDLAIYGVINHFQKIEIDSINGVDSLAEKNRVFTMLDGIHRSWTYPSDSLLMGVPLEKSSPYIQSSRVKSSSKLKTTYLLESVDNGIARIHMDYLISTAKDKENGDLMDGLISEGSGTGLLLYDMNHKQVILNEYTRDEKSYNQIMEMSVESTSTTTYRWTMEIKKN